MSKFGTCRWAHQIQKKWIIHPDGSETEVSMPSEDYTCQWLDGAGALPPPIKRQNGAFAIRPTDCARCERYEVVASPAIKRA